MDFKSIRNELDSIEHGYYFYKNRVELFQKVQQYMRDPERQIVCDILANGGLLPDPSGKRYGCDLLNLINS